MIQEVGRHFLKAFYVPVTLLGIKPYFIGFSARLLICHFMRQRQNHRQLDPALTSRMSDPLPAGCMLSWACSSISAHIQRQERLMWLELFWSSVLSIFSWIVIFVSFGLFHNSYAHMCAYIDTPTAFDTACPT